MPYYYPPTSKVRQMRVSSSSSSSSHATTSSSSSETSRRQQPHQNSQSPTTNSHSHSHSRRNEKNETQRGSRTRGGPQPPPAQMGTTTDSRHAQSQASNNQPWQSSRYDYATSTTDSRRRLGSGTASTTRHRKNELPKLRTMDVLTCPRLEEATGFLPDKAKSWRDLEVPPDELEKIIWAMSLPDLWPATRPRGNYREEGPRDSDEHRKRR
ncbi:hypothetical protein F5Y17DRAFT_340821 [Xylariaceae sp. FL0594]|nr:hypothetical protein F5Y17DRAFT_340821 [Xylariaceae sp. FL0594]